MALDNAKNFAKVTVSTGYDGSATSIVLSGGHGAKLPTAPFNVVWWNASDYPDPSDDPNVEIVRVTVVSTDTLTVTRAQESTSGSTKNTSGKTYKMIAGLTAKVINTDLANGLGPTVQSVVTGSRALSVVYHNTGVKPMFVSVTVGYTGAAFSHVYTDSSSSPTTEVCNVYFAAGSTNQSMFFIVLPGNYYEVIGGTLAIWTEWS